MTKALLYVHGMGGSAAETEQFASLCPNYEVIGAEIADFTPWGAREPIRSAFRSLHRQHHSVSLLANSIGAYFSMFALSGEPVENAFFISPVVDMEGLILNMMTSAGITENELRARKEITVSGTALSWDYFSWVRAHPVRWDIPTQILYAENDALIPRSTIDAFIAAHGAGLTVMPGGEHWFHTIEQMDFLSGWLARVTS